MVVWSIYLSFRDSVICSLVVSTATHGFGTATLLQTCISDVLTDERMCGCMYGCSLGMSSGADYGSDVHIFESVKCPTPPPKKKRKE